MKKIFIILLLLSAALPRLFAQEQQVQGIVFDTDSKERLTRVYLYNTRTHTGFYNNQRGEFNTTALPGDTLVAALQGFRVDFAIVKPQISVIIYLKRTSILLKEVNVTDSTLTPAQRLAKEKRTYEDIYRLGNDKDLLKIGGGNKPGVGLSIDALWSLFSREGKNARYLQQILERDYREAMISYRYTPGLVSGATGLTGKKIDDFMQQYRPDYYFIVQANDYQLINFIKRCYIAYAQDPAARRLPPLLAP